MTAQVIDNYMLQISSLSTPQIGQAFKPDHADTEYDRGSYMLKTLGLQVRSLPRSLKSRGRLKTTNLNPCCFLLYYHSEIPREPEEGPPHRRNNHAVE
jgi:hypothetical protein